MSASLREIQTHIHDALLDGESLDPTIVRIAQSDTKSSPEQQFAIYLESIYATHCKALKETFPVTFLLLGHPKFSLSVRAYLSSYPSNNQDLNLYGDDFAQFLHEMLPNLGVSEEWTMQLRDLANFEWQLFQTTLASLPQNFPFTRFSQLKDSDYETVLLIKSPCCSLIHSQFPIHQIWESPPSNPELSVPSGKLPTFLVISPIRTTEGKLEAKISQVDETTYNLLARLSRGHTLSQLAESELGLHLDSLLPGCIASGWISDFKATSV